MSVHDFIASAAAHMAASVDTPLGIAALCAAVLAALLIIVSSFVKTMVPLRCLAVGGNLGFLFYGLVFSSPVMALMHATLLPLNIYRAVEMVRLTRRVRAAAAESDSSGLWLKPYMRSRRLKAGDVLFRKGDVADHLYLLVEGRIEFIEIGATMDPGELFGEIAFFAPDRRRTLTARCITDCLVLGVDEATFRQLYFQNPAFGFHVVSLIAGRLGADRRRLEQRLGATAS